MEITFKNLDNDYRKGQRENIGDIQPKFWYYGRDIGSGKVLVKRQSSQNVGKKVPRSPMYNHVGEYFGYLLAQKADVKACPVELVTLHDTKNKYSKTQRIFTACASSSLIKKGASLMPGEEVIERITSDDKKMYDNLMGNAINGGMYKEMVYTSQLEDNVDLAIASVIRQTIDFEKMVGKRTDEQIKGDVEENVQDMMDMIVYDCIFGNRDRHSGNWSMEIDCEEGRTSLYSAYDNEAVLGLREPVAEIEKILETGGDLEREIDRVLFSRMGIGKCEHRATYKELLDYVVENYPRYAIPSVQKIVSRVDEKFVESLYEGMKGISERGEAVDELSVSDELPLVYKEFGMQAFRYRRDYAANLLRRKRTDFSMSPIGIETNRIEPEELEFS